MKTRIEIKGENHNEVRAFANILLTLIESNPAEYDSIVRADDSTSFNQLTATFVAYQADRTEVDNNGQIEDLTTYIDPVKFNYIFADTNLDAMNFWVQTKFDIKVRRLISAKQIPNL